MNGRKATRDDVIQIACNASSVGLGIGGSIGLQFEPYQIVMLALAGAFQVIARCYARFTNKQAVSVSADEVARTPAASELDVV